MVTANSPQLPTGSLTCRDYANDKHDERRLQPCKIVRKPYLCAVALYT